MEYETFIKIICLVSKLDTKRIEIAENVIGGMLLAQSTEYSTNKKEKTSA